MVFTTTTSIPKDLTNTLLGLVEKLHGKGYFQKEVKVVIKLNIMNLYLTIVLQVIY